MRFGTGFVVVAAFAAALPASVLADPIEDAIAARQGYFKLIYANAGPLFGMAKGEVEYSAENASTFANNLQALTSMNNQALWPAGSSKESMPGKTRALQVAWDTYPAIIEKNDALRNAAVDLAGAAGGGLDSLKSKLGALGAACKGCHETYRAKEF